MFETLQLRFRCRVDLKTHPHQSAAISPSFGREIFQRLFVLQIREKGPTCWSTFLTFFLNDERMWVCLITHLQAHTMPCSSGAAHTLAVRWTPQKARLSLEDKITASYQVAWGSLCAHIGLYVVAWLCLGSLEMVSHRRICQVWSSC